MPTIGQDCEIILDGTGYFIKPGTYKMKQPRVRKATVRADGGESYVDLGPGKRVWSMIILCLNDLVKYDGTPTGISGQQYRDALRSSYLNSTGTILQFTDPLNSTAIATHFDSYAEQVYDLHIQQVSLSTGGAPALSYEVAIELVEA
ncbi:MAG TPA: hypothetical protein VFA09_22030 [Ktedonobacteraceae bacterium]|jgi:hypothetical protein|nr:hypothetical protein [Ktedonobacteraceae bacterium]